MPKTTVLRASMKWVAAALNCARKASQRKFSRVWLWILSATVKAACRSSPTSLSVAGLAAFKAVVLEGVEVVLIVSAFGAGGGLIIAVSVGILATCVLVLLVGVVVHQPLARVPESTLKFAVGIMLSSFGAFWTGEGLGVTRPGP